MYASREVSERSFIIIAEAELSKSQNNRSLNKNSTNVLWVNILEHIITAIRTTETNFTRHNPTGCDVDNTITN